MIQLENLSFGYSVNQPINQISANLTAGSMVGLIGANGSGKSSLLKTLCGLLKPISGTIHISPILSVSYLSQYVEFERNFPISLLDLLSIGLVHKTGIGSAITPQINQQILQTLIRLDLKDYAQRNICELSGGQMQRALFARLILEDSDIILLDESFSGVDQKNLHVLIEILTEFKNQQKLVIVSTHNWEVLHYHFDQVIWLKNNQALFGPASQFKDANIDCCAY